MAPTNAQRELLKHLAEGRRLKSDMTGPYVEWTEPHPRFGWEHSRFYHPTRATVRALRKREWIDEDWRITDAGRDALGRYVAA